MLFEEIYLFSVFVLLPGVALLYVLHKKVVCPKGGLHKYKYKGKWGTATQLKICVKCNRRVIESCN